MFFWIKNLEGQFVMADQGVVEKCGCSNESEVVGKTAYDFFPAKLCEHYDADDIKVRETGEKITNRIELVPNENGTISWHSTNKIPLFDSNDKVIGVAGITRDLDKADSFSKTYVNMPNVIEYISKNYEDVIEIKKLAHLAGLSISQFERKFKEYFHESPVKFITKVRVTAACKELTSTDRTISQIALSTGFYDQSYFSKQFRQHIGISPGKYRQNYGY